jgi:F-type H+-transporting ATPase subunit b
MVDDRRDYIKQSIENADEANAKLEGIKVESETIINEAINRQNQLIKQATDEGNKLVQTAKEKASLEAQKQLEEGVKRLEVEKQKAIADIRIQVAELSVDIAEKILRKQLEDENSQQALIERFLDEVDNSDVLKN